MMVAPLTLTAGGVTSYLGCSVLKAAATDYQWPLHHRYDREETRYITSTVTLSFESSQLKRLNMTSGLMVYLHVSLRH